MSIVQGASIQIFTRLGSLSEVFMKVSTEHQKAMIQMQAIAQAKRDGIPLTEGQIIRKGLQFLELQEKLHPDLIVHH